MTSAIPGFFKLSIDERQSALKNMFDLSDQEVALLKSTEHGLTFKTADTMIENCIAMHSTPVGVATNFIVDGKEIMIPMANEEPSVIAGASFAAKLCRSTGGFETASGANICSGQVVLIVPPDETDPLAKVNGFHNEIIQIANGTMPSMLARNGGVHEVEARLIQTKSALTVSVDIHINVCDAMGANCVNTACETALKHLSEKLNWEPLMAIITNLPTKRLVHAQCKWPINILGQGGFTGMQVAQRIVAAAEYAAVDPSRGATHRKGIMNGVTAVVLATGNDTRAVEAAVHSYATQSDNPALTKYRIDNGTTLVGEIWIPIPVGVVGGSIRRNPDVMLMRKMLKVENADELARTIAAVGLANNFAAIRALVTNGICAGHMKLHSRNIACQAGCAEKHIDTLASKLIESGDISVRNAIRIIQTCHLV
ncbi:hydroxymethylglutaryl-CoA reductase, degradative family protein [Trichomonas vaginalis G3]|uniref:3-hydroxy-3-methylglutaryl coenzyme A reductase n=1 Tax=Trichomonas vaginalis (strain ATCC PRA-98 / G3) TaxID=412133 RepID=A2DVU6_TRIV3|nr:HMG-CoA reductase classII domain-containing protein [Trichomonas vaginalis G3]EAY15509.1 hydroxymethylglutaryl-CoA reductase, degradative family protein [Trichomonas vaginalis G3]KAI5511520.1 HMG-CoA reductase classII domain-containing protein [Trichomonas vaginalis G3]|eukprot:XP_001327732.1 hydroxymethylglutaryl-CoA reductase, degradative family protein [Trichomonas vaginalis G3]